MIELQETILLKMKKTILFTLFLPFTFVYAESPDQNLKTETFLGLKLGYKYNIDSNKNMIKYKVPNNSNNLGIDTANAVFDKNKNLFNVFGERLFENKKLCQEALIQHKKEKLNDGYYALTESKYSNFLLSKDQNILISTECMKIDSLSLLLTDAFVKHSITKRINFEYNIIENSNFDFVNDGYQIIESDKNKKIKPFVLPIDEHLGQILENKNRNEIINKKYNNFEYQLILNDKKQISVIKSKNYIGSNLEICSKTLKELSNIFHDETNFEEAYNDKKHKYHHIYNNIIISQYCMHEKNGYYLINEHSDIRYSKQHYSIYHIINAQKKLLSNI